MKLVFYINHLSLGGAERVMALIANAMVLRGHCVVFITDYTNDTEYELNDNVKRVILDGKFTGQNRSGCLKRNFNRIISVRKICIENRADLLVSFIEDTNFKALLSTICTSTKNIVSVRGDITKSNIVRRFLARTLYYFAEGIVFQTEYIRSYFAKAIQKKSMIISNPIAKEFYMVNRKVNALKVIVATGRIEQVKNYSMLVEAFALLSHDYNCHLRIYGEGSQKMFLQKMINRDLLLQNRVHLEGKTSNIMDVLSSASIYVLSSNSEGLPNALMEAMAVGLPCISTKFSGGGAEMLIQDGVNGTIVPCNDVVAMAHAIENYLSNPEIAYQHAQKAKQFAENFSEDKIIDKWENYFRKVLG